MTDVLAPGSEDALAMTHQPRGPEPVDEILRRFIDFAQSGDYMPAHLPGTQPKDFLRELLQDHGLMEKNIEQSGSFNFGGVTKGPKITAYHASPHDFERFDVSRIGTGE